MKHRNNSLYRRAAGLPWHRSAADDSKNVQTVQEKVIEGHYDNSGNLYRYKSFARLSSFVGSTIRLLKILFSYKYRMQYYHADKQISPELRKALYGPKKSSSRRNFLR